jgi:hypothetical protein
MSDVQTHRRNRSDRIAETTGVRLAAVKGR